MRNLFKLAIVGLFIGVLCSPASAQGRAVANVGDTIAVAVAVADRAQNPIPIPADALWKVVAFPADTVTWLTQSGTGDPGVIRGVVSKASVAGFAQVTLTLQDPASPQKYSLNPSTKFTILAAGQPTPVPTATVTTPGSATPTIPVPWSASLTITVEKAK